MRIGSSNTKSNPHNERTSLLDSATLIFFAFVYGLALLHPVRSWASLKVDLSKTFPYIPFQDSGYYLGQIEGFRSGMRGFGNPFYFEHANDGFGNGSSALFAFWGLAGRILNFDILQTYLFMTLTTGTLTAIFVGLYFRTISGKHHLATPISIATVFLVCGTELGRPSPTQLGLWIVFLLLWLQVQVTDESKSRLIWVILYPLALVFLTFSNPFYALFVGICHFLLVIQMVYCRELRLATRQLFLILISFVPFGLTYLKKFEHEDSQSERFGIINSHFPGAFKLTFLLCVTICAVFFYGRNKDKNWRIVMVSLISNLITLNSQVFTGVHYEMESHLRLLTVVCLVSTSCYLVFIYPKSLISYVLTLCLLISSSNLTNFATLFSKPIAREAQRELQVLKSVAEKANKRDVLLYQDLNFPIESQEMIGVLTSTNLYFNPAGNLSRAADREILERLACSLFINQGGLNEGLNQAYLHRFQNERLMFSKWDSLLNRFGFDVYDPDLEASTRAADLQSVINYQRSSCSDPLNFKYKLNFLIDENLRLVDLPE
jgi:hypothetical protein